MKFFLKDNDNSKKLQEIKKLMNASMNGIASERMKGMGYKLNFGVTLIRIKEITNRYNPNIQLADMLWNSDCRELKIAATMLQEPDKFSLNQAEKWIDECFNQELTEQLAKNLLIALPYIEELVQKLFAQRERKIMLYTLLTFATKQKRIEQHTIEDGIKQAGKDLSDQSITPIVTRFLKTACKVNKAQISAIINKLDTSIPILAWAREEINTEIEFGN